MADTSRLALPLLSAEQALKHVTHNEALTLLDGVVQLVVEELGLTTPPGAPEAGNCHLVGTGATGDWAGEDGNIAIYTSGGWRFALPTEGWRLWDKDSARLLMFDGSDWVDLTSTFAEIQNLPLLGVNAAADATNRLAVRTNAILLNALAAGDGGNGDVQLKLNRETGSDSATMLFQSGWSGRAEIGLAGSDDFAFKVSADGSAYKVGMTIGAANGFVTFNQMFGAAPSFPVIAGGVLTANTSYVVPAPESGTSDDVDTISGGFDGAMLVISGTAGKALTFREGTGNLKLGGNRVLDNFEDSLLLVRRGTDWLELSFANNG